MMIGKTVRGKKFLNEWFKHNEYEYDPDKYEFLYFRKCWNIRERFIEVFRDKYDSEKCQINLTIPDIYTVVEKVLKYFLIEENWYRDNSGSMWEWHQELRTIALGIQDLREFMEYADEYLITDDDIEIYFYDSY